MEDLLTAALLASTTLTDLVDDRIHWKKLPDRSALPSVSLHRFGAERTYTQQGRVPTTVWRVQFDAWGSTDAQACAVRDAVLDVLDTLRARPLQAFLETDPPDDWEPAEGPGTDGSTDIFRASLDARLVHQPTP